MPFPKDAARWAHDEARGQRFASLSAASCFSTRGIRFSSSAQQAGHHQSNDPLTGTTTTTATTPTAGPGQVTPSVDIPVTLFGNVDALGSLPSRRPSRAEGQGPNRLGEPPDRGLELSCSAAAAAASGASSVMMAFFDASSPARRFRKIEAAADAVITRRRLRLRRRRANGVGAGADARAAPSAAARRLRATGGGSAAAAGAATATPSKATAASAAAVVASMTPSSASSVSGVSGGDGRRRCRRRRRHRRMSDERGGQGSPSDSARRVMTTAVDDDEDEDEDDSFIRTACDTPTVASPSTPSRSSSSSRSSLGLSPLRADEVTHSCRAALTQLGRLARRSDAMAAQAEDIAVRANTCSAKQGIGGVWRIASQNAVYAPKCVMICFSCFMTFCMRQFDALC